ncbi:MAG: hypothetical protein AB9836_04975 [Aminipila sp.]
MPRENKVNGVSSNKTKASSKVHCIICHGVITALHYGTEDGPICGNFSCHKQYSRLKVAEKKPTPKSKL